MKFHLTQHHSGFSLIELMVSLTIFSIVMVSSIGTLLVLIDANGKAQAVSSATTNLAFAVDSMTRGIRTGRDYYCTDNNNSYFGTGSDDRLSANITTTRDCLVSDGSNDAIVFTPGFSSTTRVAYRLSSSDGVGVIEQWIDKPNQSDYWVPITNSKPPAAVNITDFEFKVRGSSEADNLQPEVAVLIAGEVQNGLASSTPFRIQSTVIQRVLNY